MALLLMLLVVALPPVANGEQASQPSSPLAGQLDAGGSHTCALRAGEVRCWGLGSSGQLGYGNTFSIGDDETPGAVGAVDVGNGRTATAISAGDFHTCALLDDGSVRCWGFGADGRLGYANTANVGDDEAPGSVGPVPLGGPATAISAGGSHTCAVLVGGSVRCWGFGLDGRLGYATQDPLIPFASKSVGDDEPPASVAPVDLGGPATAISAGGEHTCALLVGGGVRCWGDPGEAAGGDGGDGRLGYGNGAFIGDNETPAGHPLSAIACPSATQCTAVGSGGRQVTFNPVAPGTPTPTTIDDPNRTLTAVACPSVTQCTAVDNAGRQVTFNPVAPGTPTPTIIDPNRILTAVACPSVTQCTAVDGAGQQVTFDPTAPGTPTPTTVDANRFVTALACPSVTQCTAVDDTGRQVTFNPASPGSPTPTPTVVDAGHWLNAVACPSATQCTAVGRAGRQVTFNPAAPGTPTPTRIVPAAPVDVGGTATAISAGDFHTCAVLDGGSVRCWGRQNPGGRIGNGTLERGVGDNETPGSRPPVDLGAGRTATAIAAGNHTCAILNGGDVRCWGPGASGRLGYGNTNDIGDGASPESPGSVGPVDLGAGRTATAISAGKAHTCARLDNTSLRCWGEGDYGRLGYRSESDIGDNETPAAAGPVNFNATVSIGDRSAAEGNSGERTVTFVVTLSRPAGETAAVTYATANSTAQAPADYTASTGTLTFLPGETSKTVSVKVKGDTLDEPDERFLVRLSNPVNLTVARNATGTIVDDDAPASGQPGDDDAGARQAEAVRLAGLRACDARTRRHARRDLRRARRLKGARRARALRHARRHKASLRRACRRRWGRTPGRVTGLQATPASTGDVVLSFKSAGTDGTRPPAARGYVVKQSSRPIGTARAFRRATSLCGGTCRFPSVRSVGFGLRLRVTDLRSGGRYYYAVAARDNVSLRLGPRSGAVSVTAP